ncbi:hypothetical protein [Nocardiopsis sp. MG754419]|uniref:hypothetical protein n=1 Tax=Nocardiopsis sp. MG754419 TaxID=2259865 RepID=UPI001BA7AB0D|nr:hypothetical protein [Nocardiopsis sp. MG754419]MBR8741696.1 hypothetical protein [Nocardiopsis sp. MG754419]
MSYSTPSTPHHGAPSDRSPVTALVMSILMTLCCNQICGIIAIVFSVIAMGKDGAPAEQDRYIGYAWTTMGIGLALSVLLFFGYILFFSGLS